MRDIIHHLILSMEERIIALDVKDVLIKSYQLLVTCICISKILEIMCSKFDTYQYEIMASPEIDEAARQEQD